MKVALGNRSRDDGGGRDRKEWRESLGEDIDD